MRFDSCGLKDRANAFAAQTRAAFQAKRQKIETGFQDGQDETTENWI